MIPEERQSEMLRLLDAREFLTVEAACGLLDASPATVRRDFGVLAERGLAERTRGGLRRLQRLRHDHLPFALRESKHAREKAALAQAAATLVQAGDVIIVDGGTSTYHLAEALPSVPLRIITNSLRLAGALSERCGGNGPFEVHVTGGYLVAESGLLVGPQTVASLGAYHARWAFLSASGVSIDGVFNNNEFVAESERVMIRNADQVVVLADHSKIGHRSMCRVCGLDAVARLFTSARPENTAALDAMKSEGVEISQTPGIA